MLKNPDVVLPQIQPMFVYRGLAGQVEDWANKFHKAKEFYDKSRGGGAVIFILDTAGTFQDHEDLKDNNDPALNGNSTPDPDKDSKSGHGTHCGGIAGAVDNNKGVIGIAPDATLAARKVLNDSGQGAYTWIASELRKVADLKLTGKHEGKKKIISMSLGGSRPSSIMEDAIKYAISKGCFVIAAAGNSGYSGSDTIGYPANYLEVIAVGSIDKLSKPSSFSSGGKNIDISTYGNNNYSTYKNNTYATLRGTSMATPVVSGLAALIVSAYPEIDTQSKLMQYFKDNAKDIFTDGFDVRTGYGTLIAADFKKPEDYPDEPDPKPVPEPEPDPTPTPPESNPIKGDVDLWLDETYTASARNQDEGWSILKIKVAATTDATNEDDIRLAQANVARFFRGRGFLFARGSGVDRYADYIARFIYVVTKMQYGKAVYPTRVWVEKGDLKIVKDVNPQNFAMSFDIDSFIEDSYTITIDGHKTISLNKEEEMKQDQVLTIVLSSQKEIIDRDANLPIDKLKEVIGDGFGVADAAFDIFKGDTARGLLALAEVVSKYEKPMEAFKTAWAQAADLSEEESKDLYVFVSERFDIEDDVLEAKIERILKLPITGYAEFLDTADAINEFKSIWNDPDSSSFQKTRAMFKFASTTGFDQGEDIVGFILELVGAFSDLFKKKK